MILVIINFFVVSAKGKAKGYFFTASYNFDVYGNVELKTLFNATLITSLGYEFGRVGETISSVLGKNMLMGTLSIVGQILAYTLDWLDDNHCINSIIDFEDEV